MKKIILALLLLVLCSPVFSGMPADTSDFGKIRNEVMNNSKVMENLVYMCDVLGPRLMWSSGFSNSAEWIASKLKEYGIEKVYREDIGKSGINWTLKNFHATVKEPFTMLITGVPKEWTPGTNGTVTSDIIYLDVKSDADFEKYKGKLNGKIVMISPYTPLRPYTDPFIKRFSDDSLKSLSEYKIPTAEEKALAKQNSDKGNEGLMQWAHFNIQKIAFCRDEGAALVIEPGYRYYGISQAWGKTTLNMPGDITDYLIYDAGKPELPESVPQVCISMEQYNSIARAIEKGAKVIMEANLEVETRGVEKGFNLIAEIPGSDSKDEIVTIGAHMDSYTYSTAATDNTSGMSVCIEAMRVLKTLGIKPKRTIRIGLWGAEEEGLLGSKAHIEKHFLSKKEKCYAYFNMDYGAGRFRGIYAEENTEAGKIFSEWIDLLNDPKFKTVCLMSVTHSDQEAFQEAGLEGFQFIQDPMDYMKIYHTNMDFIERVSPDDLKNNALIMTIFAWLAANRDGEFPEH
jgi:hypothetical protein